MNDIVRLDQPGIHSGKTHSGQSGADFAGLRGARTSLWVGMSPFFSRSVADTLAQRIQSQL